jgi:hypothetical protein
MDQSTLLRRAALAAALIASLVFTASAGALGRARTQQYVEVVNGSFTIKAGHYRYYKMTVGEQGAVVSGRFRASGGGGNDVEVFILDPDAFENWQNGHSVRTYYNSGRVTVSTIKKYLNEGEYYLVFSNTYSVMTPKAVEAEVYLVWE